MERAERTRSDAASTTSATTSTAPVAAGSLLALQRRAGNTAVTRMLATNATIQRNFYAGATDATAAISDLAARSRFGTVRDWFRGVVQPALLQRMGWDMFRYGHLENRRHPTALPLAPAELNDDDRLTRAVIQALNASFGADAAVGHSLPGVRGMPRPGFPAAVVDGYDKSAVNDDIAAEAEAAGRDPDAAELASRDIHLRHVVMGSWIRAFPDLVHQALPGGDVVLAGRIAALLPRVGAWAGAPDAQTTGDLGHDAQLLARHLHNFQPNLVAGDGPENTLIGFVSNGLSNLAARVASRPPYPRVEACQFVRTEVENVRLVDEDQRTDLAERLVMTFDAMLDARDAGDPVDPMLLSGIYNELAFNLGTDWMKRMGGLAAGFDAADVPALQERLFRLSEALYTVIQAAGQGVRPTPRDIEVLINCIEWVLGAVEEIASRGDATAGAGAE